MIKISRLLALLFFLSVSAQAQTFDYTPMPLGATAKVVRDDLQLEYTGINTNKIDFVDIDTCAEIAAIVAGETGTCGSVVLSISPALTTPNIGVATATSVNKVAVTAPATSATLTIADGATLTAPSTASVSGTNTGDDDAPEIGDLTAIDTSAELRTLLTDELGTGVLFFLGAPAGDDQAFISSSVSAGAWGTIADSDGATQKLVYDQATNAFSAGTDDDVPDAADFAALALTGDVTSSGLATTVAANAVALTTDTTGNYAAGDAEAGAALTGDSATAFFAAGAIEAARGGTGDDTSAVTGVPRITSGDWTYDATIAHLGSSTSANLRTVLSDELGTGGAMFGLISTMADDLGCTGSQVMRRNAGDTAFECATFAGGGDALVANPLSQFAATTSAQFAGVISNESGSGLVILQTSPAITTPVITGATTVDAGSFGLTGNQSVPAWTTTGARYKNVPATLTDTTSSGTVAAAYTNAFGGNTIAASSVTTFTNYFNSYFNVPTAGANVTFTNSWAAGADSLRVGTSNPVTITTAGVLSATSPVLTTPNLGTPSAAVLTSATGLPIATGITGSSANLRTALSDEVGTGLAMFGLISTMNDDLSCTASQVVRRNSGDTAFECATVAGTGDALVANPLSQFAATTSAQLRGVLSDEVGTGAAMFGMISTMADDLGCTASQEVRRNSGDTAFECFTAPVSGYPPGHIFGLVIANDVTDASNDFTIAVGSARDEANTENIDLTGSLIKRLDAAWVAGTNQGCLNTGAEASATWYEIILIEEITTQTEDVMCSTTANRATLPATYDVKRRIGWIRNDAGSIILPFNQADERFTLITQINDVNVAATATATAQVLTVPPSTIARFRASLQGNTTAGLNSTVLSEIIEGNVTPATTTGIASLTSGDSDVAANVMSQSAGHFELRVDSSSQIEHDSVNTFGTIDISTFGWIDNRVKFGP